MVHENKYHPFPQQSRSLQTKVGQITSLQLLPGLLGWQRREPSRQIFALAFQPGQPGTSQSIPSVSWMLVSSQANRTDPLTASHKRPIRQISVWSLPP